MQRSRYEPFQNLIKAGIAKPVQDYTGPFAAQYDAIGGKQDDDVCFYLGETAPGQKVVEFGAGTGRIAIPLASQERSVVAIELSEEMLAVLKGKLLPDTASRLEVVHGSLTKFAGDEQADLVILPFNTIYHLKKREDRQAACQRAFQSLKPGGRFFVHYNLMQQDAPSEHYWVGAPPAEAGSQHMIVNYSQFDPISRLNDFQTMHFTFKDDGRYECYYMQIEEFHPPVPELKEMLVEAGFDVLGLFGDFSRTPLRECPRREMLLAEARRPKTLSENG